MKSFVLAFALACALTAAPKTYTGVVTETMCGAKHNMGITPESKCVRVCVESDPKKWKYALLVDGQMYVLSDQATPAQFAAQKVNVTGTLYEKTKILKVDKIEAAGKK